MILKRGQHLRNCMDYLLKSMRMLSILTKMLLCVAIRYL